MSGSRIPWISQGPPSNDVAFESSVSRSWTYEGQNEYAYGQPETYPVNSPPSRHTRTSSLGYSTGASPGIDSNTGLCHEQYSLASYNAHQVPHYQPGLDNLRLYQNYAQQAYHLQQGQFPASSVTERIISREPLSAGPPRPTRSTLRFGDLEPWMDVEYFNGVCGVMGWENVILKVPTAVTQSGNNDNRPQSNNPGYCFMTFATVNAATTAFAACRPLKSVKLMPNSKRPFNVIWAMVPPSSSHGYGTRDPEAESDQRIMAGLFAPGCLRLLNPTAPCSPPPDDPSSSDVHASRALEYSIFVGDLAPETTSAHLTAVFRNPILGLRLDREPKYVAPFTSCKSSKIMEDPVLGMSKGYGFVRFGSASDARRALIEMQGLYCLSRPMRISQATEKQRTQGYASLEPIVRNHGSYIADYSEQATHNRMPMSGAPIEHRRPMSGPRDLTISTVHQSSNAQLKLSPKESSGGPPSPTLVLNAQQQTPGGQQESPTDLLEKLPKETFDALSALNIDANMLAQLLRLAARPGGDLRQEASSPGAREELALGSRSALTANQKSPSGDVQFAHRDTLSSDLTSRSHPSVSLETMASAPARTITATPGAIPTMLQRSQARALLTSMVGPNGAVQNSTDPYNTTVFVGGLSGLISEDTLRTFFSEFGEIHYVKIPPGKGCGFVQFVKKADAEAAIEGLQGFPIGGGRVRLSWGRSQSDKAAQAAAQAANLGINIGQLGSLQAFSGDHTAQLLQGLDLSPGNIVGSIETSRNSSRRGFLQSSASSLYGTGDVNRQDEYINSGLPIMAPGTHDFSDTGPHLSRSQTFPSFAPLGSDASFYGGSTLETSRSTADMNPLQPSQFSAGYQHHYQGFGGNNHRHRGFDANTQSISNGYVYHDHGSTDAYAQQRGSRPDELDRRERTGSDSTSGTVQTDPSTIDIYEIANGLSGPKFSQDASGNFTCDPSEFQYRPSGAYN
ncbi:RRM protein [Tulasnella sp. 332]|nr:RRM protein [Tulasnella sp. 332]